jgi:hypothetical protein
MLVLRYGWFFVPYYSKIEASMRARLSSRLKSPAKAALFGDLSIACDNRRSPTASGLPYDGPVGVEPGEWLKGKVKTA